MHPAPHIPPEFVTSPVPLLPVRPPLCSSSLLSLCPGGRCHSSRQPSVAQLFACGSRLPSHAVCSPLPLPAQTSGGDVYGSEGGTSGCDGEVQTLCLVAWVLHFLSITAEVACTLKSSLVCAR